MNINTTPLKLNSNYILIIAMIYVTASVAADTVAYKFFAMGPLIESGATLIFPITYTIGDIITEVYGYAIARKIIWFGLSCELIFAVLLEIIIRLHAPSGFQYQNEYKDILNPILWFVLSGIFADVTSSFVNIYIISKFKIFMRGKHFIFRSIGSTAIAEGVMNIILCTLAFTTFTKFMNVVNIIISAYLLEMFYAVMFVVPAAILIQVLKRAENMDAYDINTNYSIFRLD